MMVDDKGIKLYLRIAKIYSVTVVVLVVGLIVYLK